MSRTIVIGANHTGTACIKIMLTNYGTENEVIVFDQDLSISFLGCGMVLWTGEQTAGSEGLFYSDKDELEQSGAKVYMNSPVESIGYGKKEIAALVDGQEHLETYDKSVFATDLQPIIPSTRGVSMKEDSLEFGSELENVQFVKLYQNAEDVIKRLKEKAISHVAVIGTDYIDVELVRALQRRGKGVTLIDAAETRLAEYYDRDSSDTTANNLQERGTHLAFGEAVQGIVGKTKVEKVITDKSKYDVDMVILAVGFRPSTILAQGKVKLFPNDALLVDKHQETSMPDVYAIGDYAVIHNNTTQSTDYITLASNIVRTRVAAIHNICSHELEGADVQGSDGISIHGLDMVSTGLILEKAKTRGLDALEIKYMDNQKPESIQKDDFQVTLRIVYDKTSRVIPGV